MKLTKKLFLGLSIGIGSLAMAQSTNPVLTGAPFLRISPDARAGGLGDQGVATSADAFHNFGMHLSFHLVETPLLPQ